MSNEVITTSNAENLPERISRIEREIEAAAEPSHIRNIVAMVEAAIGYARVIGENVNRLKVLRFRAEARLGEMLRHKPMNPGGRPKTSTDAEQVSEPTLREIGIDRKTSARAQKIASLPDEVREAVYSGEMKPSEALREPAKENLYQSEQVITDPPVSKDDRLEAENETLREQMEELRTNLEQTVKDNESMAKVFEADDKLDTALKEAARLRGEVSLLTARVSGLQAERNAAIQQAKSWRIKYEKLEKQMKDKAA